jgi:hypothetical protein
VCPTVSSSVKCQSCHIFWYLPKPIEVYYQTWWICSHPLSLYGFRTAHFSYWLCSCRAFGSRFLEVWWMYFYARKQNQNDDSFLRLQCLYLSYAFEQNSSILKQIVQIGSRTTWTSSGMKVIWVPFNLNTALRRISSEDRWKSLGIQLRSIMQLSF